MSDSNKNEIIRPSSCIFKKDSVSGHGKMTSYVVDVAVINAKPNPMFPKFQNLTKFIKFSKPVKCSHCGKKKKNHWTLLVFFKVSDMDAFTVKTSEKELAPLSPVCTKHLLLPISNGMVRHKENHNAE